MDNSLNLEKALELANEKLQRHEKILIQAYKSLKEKQAQLEKLNIELKETKEETLQLNEELSSTNDQLFSQNEKLEKTLKELKKAQTQLIQSEKMASVGTLTAGIAHEINNPLNFIQGGKLAIENYIEDNLSEHTNKLQPLFEIIETGIDRASNIVHSLNRFNRNSEDSKEVCDIHSILDNCLIMIQGQLKNRVSIIKEYSKDEIRFSGNESKIHQVFINILTNAEQAIENTGDIYIKTWLNNKYVCTEIQDTGCGIDKENIKKITDPFFTTKDPGKGTGLGLSIAYNIIKEHNGELIYNSSSGKGTIVTIKFPINKK
jgi:signal transduction histidine kinase